MLGAAREQRCPMLPCSESVLLADHVGYDGEGNIGTETLRHKKERWQNPRQKTAVPRLDAISLFDIYSKFCAKSILIFQFKPCYVLESLMQYGIRTVQNSSKSFHLEEIVFGMLV